MSNEVLLLISNILTGIAGWFVGKRKANAETDNQVLRNLELSIHLYKQIIDDLKDEIKQLNVKVEELERMVEQLMTENRQLKNHRGL